MIPLFLPRGQKIPQGIGEKIGEASLPGYKSRRGVLEETPSATAKGAVYQMNETDWHKLDQSWEELERIEVRPLFWGEKIPAESYIERMQN